MGDLIKIQLLLIFFLPFILLLCRYISRYYLGGINEIPKKSSRNRLEPKLYLIIENIIDSFVYYGDKIMEYRIIRFIIIPIGILGIIFYMMFTY